MSYPAPSPPHPHTAASVASQSEWRRALLVWLVIGLVVASLAGTAAFRGNRTLNGGDGAVRCGNGNLCFASFEVEQVVAFLSAQGFTCEFGACTLRRGNARYEAAWTASPDGKRVHSYEARVWVFDYGLGFPPRGEEYLAWFAALPFAHDQARADEAQQWLAARNSTALRDEVAMIGGYEYRLDRPPPDASSTFEVTLHVGAGETWR